ncbi:hypothetical protein MRB53_038302 [Persea americana]|nr:hypothetical protein MRB53_038302 [Persea americana]
MDALIQCGQQISRDFMSERRPEIRDALTALWGLMAYKDTTSSPLAHLVDLEGRNQIAEELNAAIMSESLPVSFSASSIRVFPLSCCRAVRIANSRTVSLGKASTSALELLYAQTEVLVDELAQDGRHGHIHQRAEGVYASRSSPGEDCLDMRDATTLNG